MNLPNVSQEQLQEILDQIDQLQNSQKELNQRISVWKRKQNLYEVLDIGKIYLREMPQDLPIDVKILHLYSNNMVTLDNIFPPSLTVFKCENNRIRVIPDTLPYTLRELDCRGNELTELPKKLPKSLEILKCSRNRLTTLPDLPIGLKYLDFSNNFVEEMPKYIPDSLDTLICNTNKLTVMPCNMHCLTTLWCFSNRFPEDMIMNQHEPIPNYADRWKKWWDTKNG
jgi:Leucine-rich repeat (LRR) protein